jgi:hypothetical protein
MYTGTPGLTAVTESADRHLIVAGLAGVKRLPKNKWEEKFTP